MPQMSGQSGKHRFFAEDLSPASVSLPDDEAHHALHVLRLGAGATVELFDGRGGRARASIVQAGRDGVVVRIDGRDPPAQRPRPVVHLAFAVPKGKRLGWLLEKATELGAASLRPVEFERSVAGAGQWTPAKRGRRLIRCIQAAKQCGLDFLPELADPAPLGEFLADRPAGVCLFGRAGPDATALADALSAETPPQAVCLMVGPEGDLTPAEADAARHAGFEPVRLGQTTLRVETAAVALLAGTIAILG